MKSFKTLIFLINALVLVSANSDWTSNLPADWSSIRSAVDTSFSCEGRPHGYYADLANDCQIYHVCNPNDGQITHSPFICPQGTVFDQRTLNCVHVTPEFSCGEQASYYGAAPINSVPQNPEPANPPAESPVESPVEPPADTSNSITPVVEVSSRRLPAAPKPVTSRTSTVAHPREDSSEVSSPVVGRVVGSASFAHPPEDSSEVSSHPVVGISSSVAFRDTQEPHSPSKGPCKGSCKGSTKGPSKSPSKVYQRNYRLYRRA